MKNPALTREAVVDRLIYDPDTGEFRFRKGIGRRRAGDIAGTTTKFGYRAIRFGRDVKIMAHRLAWFYVHGEWPTNEIDHINGDPSDNRISNLRQATRAENARNRGKASHNTSGFKGVCFDRTRGRWMAAIGVRRSLVNLGRFDTPEAAHAAYVRAAQAMHGEYARLA